MITEINCQQCGKHLASMTEEQMKRAKEIAFSGVCYVPLGYHDNCPARFDQYDRVKAIFNPQNMDTLRDEAQSFIDRPLMFEAQWIIEDGEYDGQWAFQPLTMDGRYRVDLGWVPQEDIEVYHRF